jgi:hypothetical protein
MTFAKNILKNIMKNFQIFLLLVVGLTGCSSLLYYPRRVEFSNPSQVGANYDRISLLTEDGIQLEAWRIYSPKVKTPKARLVFFHGNAQNLSSHFHYLIWALDFNYEIFIFSYRGFYKNKGDPTPRGTLSDGLAALDWVQKQSQKDKIPWVAFGQSLGGAVLMRSLAEKKEKLGSEFIPPVLVAIDCSFHSYQEVGRKVLAKNWFTWPLQWLSYFVLSDRYAPNKKIANLSPIPLLVMHGTQDPTVSYSLGERIFEIAREPKYFWPLEGAGHTDVFFIENFVYRKKFDDLVMTQIDKEKSLLKN